MTNLKLQNSIKLVIVDDEDFERLNQYKWFLMETKGSFQIIRTKTKNKHTTSFNLGSEILNVDSTVDHKDRNVFNCQKENLRQCTTSQNRCNQTKSKIQKSKYFHSQSKYKGVRRTKTLTWEARISYERKCFQLGTFNTEQEAALAYNKAAVNLHKEFAVLNII